MKTLVVTEKKSVADDFAKVLGGFAKKTASYEREDMVIAWASGHLLELQGPSAYDKKKWGYWALENLPIIPERFQHVPREGQGRTKELLNGLVRLMQKKDVGRIVNACDAGREGELIFNLVLDHAGFGMDDNGGEKEIQRLWLQSMTARSIGEAFDKIENADLYRTLRSAAYARDEADWLVGMNGTRAFTKKFMGRAARPMAVGRVKTPTLAFLVDRERAIDRFVPVSYFQVDAEFETGSGAYSARWSGLDDKGKKIDRLSDKAKAEAIVAKVSGQAGIATDKTTRRTEIPPLLFDLTTIQREASNRFGYTLDRTLSIVQSLYEAKKAVTYPRTSSRYLPEDYAAEIPKLVTALRSGPLGHVADRALAESGGPAEQLKPMRRDRVFNDAKVSDHFALIPTGENPKNLRDDEAKIYEIIVRRFLAAFLPSAEWENVARETVVLGETFVTPSSRRLTKPGWRAVEPRADHKDLPALKDDGAVTSKEVELLEKETQPPSRYTDGSLVKAMETAGKDAVPRDGEELLDDEILEELKEKGIGTPATRAAILKDLIYKRLAKRQGRSILPTPLGCTLVRLVRNLDLEELAKPDLTGDWEYRLAQMAEGHYDRGEWDAEIRNLVTRFVSAIKDRDGGNDQIFAVDHPDDARFKCVVCDSELVEKTFSYMCSAPATITGEVPGPYELSSGDSFTVAIDGKKRPFTITFSARQFKDIAAATADEVADAINAEIKKAVAAKAKATKKRATKKKTTKKTATVRKEAKTATAEVCDGRVVLKTESADNTSALQLADGDGGPLAKLGLPVALREKCEFSLGKDQKGKYLFPETAIRLLEERKIGPLTGFDGTKAPGHVLLKDDGFCEIELELSDDDDDETPGESRYEQVAEGTVMGKCPKCKDDVTRQGTGYKCVKNIPRKKDKECDFRRAEKIKYRFLPPDQIRLMLKGEKTEELFGFVSMRGFKFKAKLFYNEEGELQWEFPPRKAKKKATKKKAGKKKATKKPSADPEDANKSG